MEFNDTFIPVLVTWHIPQIPSSTKQVPVRGSKQPKKKGGGLIGTQHMKLNGNRRREIHRELASSLLLHCSAPFLPKPLTRYAQVPEHDKRSFVCCGSGTSGMQIRNEPGIC